ARLRRPRSRRPPTPPQAAPDPDRRGRAAAHRRGAVVRPAQAEQRPRRAIAPASSSATFQTGQAGFDDGGGGYMWAGSGPRDRIVHVDFVKPFAEAPTVVVALSGV